MKVRNKRVLKMELLLVMFIIKKIRNGNGGL